jgi:hypothetical protein
MDMQNEVSTQRISNEEWEVTAGKKSFILNEKQIAVLKDADIKGHRGLIWFDKFAISIPHISSIERISKAQPKPYQLEKDITLSKEEQLERIQEIRNKFFTSL